MTATTNAPELSSIEKQMLEIAKQNAETNRMMAQVAMQMMAKNEEPGWATSQWEGVKKFHQDHTVLAVTLDVLAIVGIGTLAYNAYNAYNDVQAGADLDLTSADRLRAVG